MAALERSSFCPRFLLEEETAVGSEICLTAEDSHHAARVLRMREGDSCEVVAPSGLVYSASFVSLSGPARVLVAAEAGVEKAGGLYRVKVGVVQALARPSAVDYVIEKGTEVGASYFLLVPTAGSPPGCRERLNDRLERWQRIARAATKQSKQTVVPQVRAATSVAEAIDQLAAERATSVVLAPNAPEALFDLAGTDGANNLALWIGPEGGWEPSETALFERAGLVAARLGKSVLRTETAGPIAVVVARLARGDW